MRKRYWFLLVLLALVAVCVFVAPSWLAKLVRERSVEAVEDLCGPNSRIRIQAVELDLTEGYVAWRGIGIEQMMDSTDTTWTLQRSLLIRGRVDSITVHGLSIWRLLTRKTLAMRTLAVNGPDLELITARPDTTAGEGPRERGPLHAIRIDTLRLDSGLVQVRNVRAGRPELVTRVRMQATDIDCDLANGQHVALRFRNALAHMDDARIALPPLYDAWITSIDLNGSDSLITVHDIRLTPRMGPKAYRQAVRYETDLFDMHMDSLALQGMDLLAFLNDNTLRTQVFRLSGTDMKVYRDKSMPDGPYLPKRMPAKLLRDLPMRLRVDTLAIDGLNVRYYERDTLTPDFGEVAFTEIRGAVTGLNTVEPVMEPPVHLAVTAKVYDRAAIRLDFQTSIPDSSDRFVLHAKIGALPFQVFNRMTDDLVLVQATAGTVHGIDYRLNATDDRAKGRVEIEYEDLDVRVRKRDGTRQENKLLSFVVNQLKRNKNLRSDPNFRGGDLEIERWKDRQIFNYIWRGLKEGIMLTVMPKVLGDVQQMTKSSVDKRVQEERGKARRARKRQEKDK